jgi:hypothetical protein
MMPLMVRTQLIQTAFFVRQHYLDFLNREPDTAGFDFWKHEIDMCGSDPQCVEVKRNNVSAAFFVSIEFQETGYLVYRIYKSAFNNLPALRLRLPFRTLFAIHKRSARASK